MVLNCEVSVFWLLCASGSRRILQYQLFKASCAPRAIPAAALRAPCAEGTVTDGLIPADHS